MYDIARTNTRHSSRAPSLVTRASMQTSDVPTASFAQHLPPFSPVTEVVFFADRLPEFQGVVDYDDQRRPSELFAQGGDEDAKLKALRARNSAAQKRYQAKQKAKMTELEAQQQQLDQRLHELKQEQAQLNKHAALLTSRLRGQEDQLHDLLSGLDLWAHGPALPHFNGDYNRPQMCGIDIPLVAPPELIEQHKHTTYEDLVEHYSRIVADMHQHLAEADAAPDTAARDVAHTAVAKDVEHMCAIFMAAAVHNPLNVKKILASVGMKVSWRAIESQPPDLVSDIQECVADLALSNRNVDHIMALRDRCLRMLGASIITRRHIVHELAFTTAQGSVQPMAHPIRGGLLLSATTCSRGRALSILRVHQLLTKLHASMIDSHIHVMHFVEDLYNTYLLPKPINVARCCVKTFPYFPDDLSFATAVGIVYGRLDNAGRYLDDGQEALCEEEEGAVRLATERTGACLWQTSKGSDTRVSIAATAVEIS